MRERKPAEWHTWVEARLSSYIDDALAPDERAQVEQHLGECAPCRASLASLQWTRDLLKQAPAPQLPRAFFLPVPASRAPARTFAFVRVATAFATLLLIAVISADLILQSGGAPMPSPAPAAEKLTAPTQLVALSAQPTPTAPRDAIGRGMSPTEAAKAAEAASGTPAPIMPPAPAREMPTSTGAPADNAPKAVVATPTAPRPLLAAAPPVTATLPAPTATLTPTATLVPTATRVEPTRTPIPISDGASWRGLFLPLRIAEFGLLFVVVFFAVMTILLWKKR